MRQVKTRVGTVTLAARRERQLEVVHPYRYEYVRVNGQVVSQGELVEAR